MSRIARNKNCSKYYHVMVQGINKEKIFEKDEFKKIYLKYLFKNIKDNNAIVIAYCVMTNHIHILFYTEKIEHITNIMSYTNQKFAMFYNKYCSRCGYVFRNRFRSDVIKDQKHLYCCIRYIHNNPVKAGICANPGQYNFSSYNLYINNKISENILELIGTQKNINIITEGNDNVYKFSEINDEKECEDIDEKILEIISKNYDPSKTYEENFYNSYNAIKNTYNVSNEKIRKLLQIKKTTFYRLLKN